MQGWGKHLIIDAKGCFPAKAQDPEYIRSFIMDTVRLIEMTPFGETKLTHFADNTDFAGWTAIQLIETSSIVAHFLDINGDLYLDVFSCKDFEEQRVMDNLELFFSPDEIKHQVIWRDARS
jgi:S-adenosylmethionine/arginine decarboxylase-like enzyme